MSDLSTIPSTTLAALEAAAHDDAAIVRVAAAHFETAAQAVALMTAADVVANTRILWVNQAFTRLTGYEAAAVVGRSSELLAGAHVDAIHAREIDLLRDHPENARFGIVTRKQRPDLTWFDVEERIVPLHGRPGVITHHLLVQRGIAS